MRKAINDNQVVQVALVGILLVVVGFLFMTRIAGGGGEEAAPTPSATEASAAAAALTPAATEAAPGEPAVSADSATGSESGASVAAAEGEFAAGPGLPGPVVRAHEAGKTVVLLVLRRKGIDDRKLQAQLGRSGSGDTAVFVTRAKGISEYSRIAQGVKVDRVPALVVIQPKRLVEGALPAASVSYGYRGPESIAQAVRDAGYKGPRNLPYYPE